nr:hypothetical protein [Gilliamella apicola]
MLHVDTKRLPLLKNETKQQTREYLFVGIDDFSRELYAGIYPDKPQFSSDTYFELRRGIISKYLATQKRENKNLNALLIFIIPLNRIKRFQGKRFMSF